MHRVAESPDSFSNFEVKFCDSPPKLGGVANGRGSVSQLLPVATAGAAEHSEAAAAGAAKVSERSEALPATAAKVSEASEALAAGAADVSECSEEHFVSAGGVSEYFFMHPPVGVGCNM